MKLYNINLLQKAYLQTLPQVASAQISKMVNMLYIQAQALIKMNKSQKWISVYLRNKSIE